MPIGFNLRLTNRAELSVDACDTCYTLVPSTMLTLHEATHTPSRPGSDADLMRLALELLADLVDPEDCNLDHHGGCQAHGYFSLEQGELCPHQAAKNVLDLHGIDWR